MAALVASAWLADSEWGVGDVDVIGAVAGHELVAGDAGEDGMDDGPLVGGLVPAAFGLLRRQRNRGAEAEVAVKGSVFDEDAAPDEAAGFADAFERAPTEGEVHGWLAGGGGARVAADEVIRGCGAGDLEEPDELV